ncbi:MAG: hypothetical protein GEU88_11140 [Solirubrobacterales bacterium]|nr:hypothetical protein [Solirubrobacterales bacterium]
MVPPVRSYEESPFGFTWVLDEPLARASHAIAVDGRVWIIDPTDVPEAIDRARSLGQPAAVVQLLDRHNRDCAAIAAGLEIPHLKVPDEVPDSPFETIAAVRVPGWRETALWWPAQAALVVAEVVGTNSLYTGGGEGVGMHIMLRALPPGRLRGMRPEHLLVGHGAPVHGDEASAGLERAYERARRDLPRALLNAPRAMR